MRDRITDYPGVYIFPENMIEYIVCAKYESSLLQNFG